MSSSSSGPSTPFEWLSGGLFFGNKGDSTSQIDSCKDAGVLLQGVHDSMAHVGTDEFVKKQEEGKESAEILLAARLRRLRFLLYDERRQTSQSDSNSRKPAVATRMADVLTKEGATVDLIPSLLNNIHHLPFEARKDAAAIFNYFLVCGLDGQDAQSYTPVMALFQQYVKDRFEQIMTYLVEGHAVAGGGGAGGDNKLTPDVVLHCGAMYRSCLKHIDLFKELVLTPERVESFVFPFLDTFAHSPNFDLASDAMESLKVVFGVFTESRKDLSDEAKGSMYVATADFLDRDYDEIWVRRFNPKLLSSEKSNYIIRRMALQILSSVLLTRSNYKIMVRYIAAKQNLIMIMLLLRDKSPHITLDAFHVFKIFVANPNKPAEVIKILSDNKVKLCAYLETLHKEKEAKDEQFRDEKALVISTLKEL